MDERHIWIVRHAKSAEGSPGMRDHDRPLNPRGERDGAAMQAWFAAHPHKPSWIWTSTALRARTTAGYIAEGTGATLIESADLYLAGPEAALACLRETPDDVACVVLVAHNPGLTYLVNQLGSGYVTDNLVTFGSALFSYRGAWHDLRSGAAEFVELTTPRTL